MRTRFFCALALAATASATTLAASHPLMSDRFRVVGPAKIPSLYGRRANQAATRVNEDGYIVDPVRGTASAFATVYFLTPLAKARS
jgi:hypothetical protein